MNQQVEHSPGGSPDTTRDCDGAASPPLPPQVGGSWDWRDDDNTWNETWNLLMKPPADGSSPIPEVPGLTSDELRPALLSKDVLRVPIDDRRLIEPVRSWPRSGFPLVLPLTYWNAQVWGFAALPTRVGVAAPMVCDEGVSPSEVIVTNEPGLSHLGMMVEFPFAVWGLGVLEILAIALAIPDEAVVGLPVTKVDPPALKHFVEKIGMIIAYPDGPDGDAAAAATEAVALAAGAPFVRRLKWPAGTHSAMDVVARAGVAGLRAFLLEQGLER